MLSYKLVRDKIPEIIFKTGGSCTYSALSTKNEYIVALGNKCIEEVQEINDAIKNADREHTVEELADLTEVLECLIKVLKIDVSEIRAKQIEKRNEKGSFTEKIFLREISR